MTKIEVLSPIPDVRYISGPLLASLARPGAFPLSSDSRGINLTPLVVGDAPLASPRAGLGMTNQTWPSLSYEVSEKTTNQRR